MKFTGVRPSSVIVAPSESDQIFPQLAEKRADRLAWVDLLRALGIVLVVIGHALGGLIDFDAALAKWYFRPLFAFIYVFHMPLFFFLSGLFVAPRLRQGGDRFRRSLWHSVAWPYLLWSAVQVFAIWAAGSLVNNPVDNLGERLVSILWAPPSQFWFLYGLFFFHVAALLVLPRLSDSVVLVIAMTVASIAQLDALSPVPEAIMRMFPYYALGVIFGPALTTARAGPGRPIAWSILALAPAAIGVSLWNALDKGVPGRWPAEASAIVSDVNGFQNFFAALLAIAALVLLARRYAAAAPRWLLRCGQLTMPIFVLHILFIAALRIVAMRVVPGMDGGALLLVLCAAGLGGPIVAYMVARRLGVARALGL